MGWSKLKNIIIILLAIVNAFLLGQEGLRQWRSHETQRQTRERMVEILARSDVDYLPEQVPGALEGSAFHLTVDPPDHSWLQVLIGEIASTSTQGSQSVYTGEKGSAACSATGEVRASFLPGALAAESGLPALLESLGVEVGQEERREEPGRTTLRYPQLWNGAPISGLEAQAVIQDGWVEELQFRRLAGTDLVSWTQETITAPTALIRFLDELNRGEGYVCSQVTALYAGYVLSGGAAVTLTPAWLVETDTWRFTVDGVTGAVTAAER